MEFLFLFTVVIYNCGELGKDCSVCRSLNDTKDKGYVCDWCAEKCVYPTASCTDPCPSPTVTSVSSWVEMIRDKSLPT